MTSPAFDLSATYAHLGLGSTVTPLPGFEWSPDYLERYQRETESDGEEGRLVTLSASEKTWTTWERHPAGDELVLQLFGSATLIQEIDGRDHAIELRAGLAAINPRGVWHTVDVREPGQVVFITPGRGTEHRPR